MHYLRHDFRRKPLEIIVKALQNSISELNSQIHEISWYDGGWFVEEAEPILGMAYVAFQNYINSSIYDRFINEEDIQLKIEKSTKINKTIYYKKGNILTNDRTDIELICAIANYFKHRDDLDGAKHARIVLTDLNLDFDDILEPENLPIIRGTEILSEKWDLLEITKIVTDWRESLWNEEL